MRNHYLMDVRIVQSELVVVDSEQGMLGTVARDWTWRLQPENDSTNLTRVLEST